MKIENMPNPERMREALFVQKHILGISDRRLVGWVARQWKMCGRCGCEAEPEAILEDSGGRGVCEKCDSEIKLKRSLKPTALGYTKCKTCGEMSKRVYCRACEVRERQKHIADDASAKLKTRAVMSLVSRSALRKHHLPEILIETKTAEMKLRHLWQSPKTSTN